MSIIMAVAIFAIYFFINEFHRTKVDLGDVIPERSALVLKVNNPLALFDELSNNNLIWKSLDSTNLIYQLLSNYNHIDSVLQIKPGIS